MQRSKHYFFYHWVANTLCCLPIFFKKDLEIFEGHSRVQEIGKAERLNLIFSNKLLCSQLFYRRGVITQVRVNAMEPGQRDTEGPNPLTRCLNLASSAHSYLQRESRVCQECGTRVLRTRDTTLQTKRKHV